MENSGKLLFEEDETPKWYVATADEWSGPMTSAEVVEKIQSHQITWAHFVWRRGQPGWKRICDSRIFQPLVPRVPSKAIREKILKSEKSQAKKNNKNREWYLYYKDTQFGPFSVAEVNHLLAIGKIHLRVFAWKEDLENWQRLGEIETFKEKADQKPSQKPDHQKPDQRSNQRTNPRRPLLARILITNEQTVIMGVCRDISTGGLQVLTEKIPGEVNTKLKMNISPSTNDAGSRIEAFVAQGTIVRILEDGRGFSFRFENLTEHAKKAIESYIQSPA